MRPWKPRFRANSRPSCLIIPQASAFQSIIKFYFSVPGDPRRAYRIGWNMAEIAGLQGLRAAKGKAEALATPPYDVIKEGSPLENLLNSNPESFFHVTLGPDASGALKNLTTKGVLIQDAEPAFYVYEQKWNGVPGVSPGGERLGFFAAV